MVDKLHTIVLYDIIFCDIKALSKMYINGHGMV